MAKTNRENTTADGLSPEAVFRLLGDETRLRLLRVLWEAETPLSFSELAAAAGTADAGNFNYHLEKLTRQFIRRTEGGYELRQTGRRVVSLVLSGMITASPTLAPTKIDAPCPHCGSPIVITYADERLLIQCTECRGSYRRMETTEPPGVDGFGAIAVFMLPPAGIDARSSRELLRTALRWDYHQIQSLATGVCPRCAGSITLGLRCCERHEPTDGICPHCRSRYAVLCAYLCEHCEYFRMTTPLNHVVAKPPIANFYYRHGVDVTRLDWADTPYLADYDEEILALDPLRLRLGLAVNDEFTIVLDEELEIIEIQQ